MTYLAVIIAFGVFFLTMAIGVMMGRKPIAGSCGGLAQVGLNGECKVCGKTPGSCDPEILGKNIKIDQNHIIDASKTGAMTKDTTNNIIQNLNIGRYKDPLDF